MAVFEYKGLNAAGKGIAGIIDADSPKSARIKLRRSGVFPTEVIEGKRDSSGISFSDKVSSAQWFERGVKLQDISIMTRQMATLIGARLPLMEALTALMDQVDKGNLKRIIAGLREEVREGSSMADAMKGYPSVFSELYINMVRAGEESGTLDIMLFRLADFLENQVKLKNKVVATMTYPVLMIIIGTAILFGIITFVIPKVVSVFEDMEQTLPLPTIILIGLSDFLREYWWLILGVGIIILFFLKQYISTSSGRDRYDQIILKTPLIGRLVKTIAISRFTRTLSTLLSSGIPLLNAISIVKNVLNNNVMRRAIESAQENIKEGETFAEPLKKSRLFPPLVTHMISIGEKSGELEDMLLKVSDAYDNEVETTINSVTSIMSPIMILVMGIVVFFIIMAILLPIFEMSQIVA
ncbi:MAG: type II secretion system inner membrane protein GspF [Nitrospirota bacterium]